LRSKIYLSYYYLWNRKFKKAEKLILVVELECKKQLEAGKDAFQEIQNMAIAAEYRLNAEQQLQKKF
jgi:hypothetical protein